MGARSVCFGERLIVLVLLCVLFLAFARASACACYAFAFAFAFDLAALALLLACPVCCRASASSAGSAGIRLHLSLYERRRSRLDSSTSPGARFFCLAQHCFSRCALAPASMLTCSRCSRLRASRAPLSSLPCLLPSHLPSDYLLPVFLCCVSCDSPCLPRTRIPPHPCHLLAGRSI